MGTAFAVALARNGRDTQSAGGRLRLGSNRRVEVDSGVQGRLVKSLTMRTVMRVGDLRRRSGY